MLPKESWAAVLERSLVRTTAKNVLEVVLEKDFCGSYTVSQEECAKLLLKLGLDMRNASPIEAIQICPSGRGVLYIRLKDNVDLNKYCRYDVINVTKSGIRAIMVKPAGRREVVVNVRGIHPSTKV